MKKTSESKLLAKIVDLESKLKQINTSEEFAYFDKLKAEQERNEAMDKLAQEKKRADELNKAMIDRTVELELERARHKETFAALRIARRMIEAATERREP